MINEYVFLFWKKKKKASFKTSSKWSMYANWNYLFKIFQKDICDTIKAYLPVILKYKMKYILYKKTKQIKTKSTLLTLRHKRWW